MFSHRQNKRGRNKIIPELEHGSGSWIVTVKSTGKVVGEFYCIRSLKAFNPDMVVIETAKQYLERLNREHNK
jgi:hypothetical protein